MKYFVSKSAQNYHDVLRKAPKGVAPKNLGQEFRRHAFTLVELLVAMTIFVILATITISAWRGTERDRVSNAAAVFKNALEGAKSRAIKSMETRGLRLLLDPGDPTVVTSMIYVDGGQFVPGTLYAEYDNRGTGRYAIGGADEPPTNDPEGYIPESSGRWRVTVDDTSVWDAYESKGLIGPGTLIEIARGKGFWLRFTGLTEIVADSTGTHKWWILDGQISDASSSVSNPGDAPEDGRDKWVPSPAVADATGLTIGLTTAIASDAISYRMQLMPAILPGAEPISFPANTCVDLNGSKVPQGWRPDVGVVPPKVAYGPYGGYMDILFTPRGNIARPLVTEGILHFSICSLTDVQLGKSVSTYVSPFINSNYPLNGLAPQPYPVVITDLEHGGKLVSIVTQTGGTLNADIFPHNSDTIFNNDSYNFNGSPIGTNPYYNVYYGKESK